MSGWIEDARNAVRGMARRPGFAAGVVLTLGLGIGATTTIFSVVDAVLLERLPYEEPDRLAALGATFPTREWADEGAGRQHLAGMSVANFVDFAERSRSFESLAAVESSSSVLIPDRGDGPELVAASSVSEGFFEMLGVAPAVGRLFLPHEYSAGSDAVFLLSWGAWQRRFGGDPDVIGRALERIGTNAEIVGVLPRDFTPPEAIVPGTPDFWMPLQPDHDRYAGRGRRSVGAIGRLGPGVTVEAAREEARAIAAELARDFPDGNVYPDGSHFGIGVNGLHAETVGGVGRTLGLFLGAATLLLGLSAMNAATLLLARALDRRRELGVRSALGASRLRVTRLLLVEALVLSGLGGLAGIAVAAGGVELFLALAPRSIPRIDAVAVDTRVLFAAAAVTLASGLAAGLLPAVRLSRAGPWTRLHGGGRGSSEPTSRLRSALVGAQIAVAVLLLSGAGLLFNSFVRIVNTDPGFEPDDLVSMNVAVKRPGAPEGEEMWQAWDLVLAEIARVPGVTAWGCPSNTPYQSPKRAPRIHLPGEPPEKGREGVAGYSATPGYFDVIGSRLLAGRGFEPGDRADTEPVAIVNETFVRTVLGGDEAVGAVLHHMEGEIPTTLRVVGVVEDMVQTRAEDGPAAAVYRPYTQADWPWLNVVVRSATPPEELIPELRRAVTRFSSVVPPRQITTMRDRMSATRIGPRFQTLLIGAFAAVALALAAAGLYGSLAHAVRRRRREMGVRVALGAERRRVVLLVLRQGLGLVLAGLIAGLVGTLASTRVLAGYLYGVEPNDPATIAGVGVVLVAVAVVACLVPARRATRVDPVEVLRTE